MRAPHSIQNGNSSGLSLAQAEHRTAISARRFEPEAGRPDLDDIAGPQWARRRHALVVDECSTRAGRHFQAVAALASDDARVLVADLIGRDGDMTPDAAADRRGRPIDAELV